MKHARKPSKPPVTAVTDDPELSAAAKDSAAAIREEAFLAEEAEWNGFPLQPFSSGRESLFYQLRHAAGAAPMKDVLDDFDAFFADAIRILYLCSHTPEQWRPHRREPLAWLEAIEAWADSAIPLARKGEAIVRAMAILTAAYRNRHEPAPPENPRHERELGN